MLNIFIQESVQENVVCKLSAILFSLQCVQVAQMGSYWSDIWIKMQQYLYKKMDF